MVILGVDPGTRRLGWGVVTREDLAEQAVDDLNEIAGLDPERAAKLIMAARAHWFEQEQQAKNV